ncbi:hypothetical protein PH586_10495 [Pseudomonas sp. SA3-5]|uniref:DUF805 domain-containing protein n=1 Tax=Pseudomonas aestuarii TaxID=3018340 RepID=A0ABT4XF29_9PSED|nr:hypothetical protein [Pseudomonas aestuarii]MDA7086810.1 hypothetical protein [Pseudomonas aestuarii]
MHDPSIWPFGPVMMLLFLVLITLPFCLIFKKAGYSQWLGLLMVVPIVNFVLLYFLAFSSWPAERSRTTPADE